MISDDYDAIGCGDRGLVGATLEAIQAHMRDVWIAVRANLRAVLEDVTLADLASGTLPRSVKALARNPDAWLPR